MPASDDRITDRYGTRSRWRPIGLITSLAVHALVLAALLLGWRSYTPPPQATAPTVVEMIPLQPETEAESPTPPPPPEEPVLRPEPRDAAARPVVAPLPVAAAPIIRTLTVPLAMATERNPTEPPPPAPMTPPQPPPPPPADLAPDSWEGRVLARLIRFRRYPPAAHRARIEGVPLVRFTLDRRGRVLDSRLERSSGNPLLDREATSLPQRAQPMPAPPDERPGTTISLVVPVEFLLR